jgi:hypothetical protein
VADELLLDDGRGVDHGVGSVVEARDREGRGVICAETCSERSLASTSCLQIAARPIPIPVPVLSRVSIPAMFVPQAAWC